jgi:two-component system response regulator HydG
LSRAPQTLSGRLTFPERTLAAALPLNQSMSTTAQAELSQKIHREPPQIWVLSEDPAQGELEQTLEHLGVVPNMTDDPREVLAQIAGGQSYVVLCDADLTSMNGLTFLAEALHLNPLTQVILMSAAYSPAGAIQAIKRGAYDYLAKPVGRLRLKEAIDDISEWLARQQRVCQIERQLASELDFHGMVARAPAMRSVFDEAAKMSRHYSALLLTGPGGAGKERLARAIHQMSPLSNQRFVICKCAGTPGGPLEDRLFGRGRGAPPAVASEDKPGLLECTSGGTLYLDEVSDLPLAVQAKLQRVIADREVSGPTASKYLRPDVRIIAASSRDLRTEVLASRFREDLFCQLDAAQIQIPSLTERREDIPLLVDLFLVRSNAACHKHIQGVTPRAMATLVRYTWPGNVRELENLISTAAQADLRNLIDLNDLPESVQKSAEQGPAEGGWPPMRLRDVRRDHIERVLDVCHGNRVRAAQLLGIGRTSLYRHLKRRTKSRASESVPAS